MRKWNFSAGPAAIPEPVLQEAQSELLEWKDSGMSVMEMSHRSSDYIGIANQARQDLIDLLEIPNDYQVLFLQGGATLQFSMIPMNFGSQKIGDYALTGSWSKKAINEAAKIIDVNVLPALNHRILIMCQMRKVGTALRMQHTCIMLPMKQFKVTLYMLLQ